MRKITLCLILLLATALVLFFVDDAKADGNMIVVVGPKEEAIEHVDIGGSGNISGYLSVGEVLALQPESPLSEKANPISWRMLANSPRYSLGILTFS
jgi:hypothetical protein